MRYVVCYIFSMDKNTQDLLETVIFIKDHMITNMATKDDIANMATKDDITNMATKDDLLGMATKDDLLELRQEMHEGFAAQGERIGNLEKSNREILDVLHPLSQAHSADAVTIVRHEQRITRIEKQLAMT